MGVGEKILIWKIGLKYFSRKMNKEKFSVEDYKILN